MQGLQLVSAEALLVQLFLAFEQNKIYYYSVFLPVIKKRQSPGERECTLAIPQEQQYPFKDYLGLLYGNTLNKRKEKLNIFWVIIFWHTMVEQHRI